MVHINVVIDYRVTFELQKYVLCFFYNFYNKSTNNHGNNAGHHAMIKNKNDNNTK